MSVLSNPSTRPLKPGVYAPIPSFFHPGTEDLDVPSFEKHVVRVASAGVGLVICGSMGEAIHLTHAERMTLIRAARRALDGERLSHVPIIAGTGAGSTRETIELCKEAADAGADYTIVIASGYFAGALNKNALKNFWSEISDRSPIPVMIYNYPAASGGIDLDSNLITELATECPNVCGVKLTCGNVGKLARIADVVATPSFAESHPRRNSNAPFLVLGGYSDFLTPASFVKGHGAITGLANLAPNAIAKLFHLSEQTLTDISILSEVQRMQGIIAHADFTIAKTSIAGTKFLLDKLYGYGGLPRKPLPPLEPAASLALWEHPHTQALIKLENDVVDSKIKLVIKS